MKHVFDIITKIKNKEDPPANNYEERVINTITTSILYPYQLISQLYFCNDFLTVDTTNLKGLLLYYNMGTGKTITAVASAYEYIRKYPKYKKIVILLKTGLESTWFGTIS